MLRTVRLCASGTNAVCYEVTDDYEYGTYNQMQEIVRKINADKSKQ